MIKLFVNKFECSNAERAREYDYCLKMNEANPLIDQIVLVESQENPSYEQVFALFDDNAVNILANSDIYFDETIQFAKMIVNMEFWCLTRWELYNDQIVFFDQRHKNHADHAKWAQDAWVCLGKPKIPRCNFRMGVPGCDNKIAYLADKAGYVTRNPSYTIRAIHVHRNDFRPPRDADRLPPPYKWVLPTTLRR